MLQESPNLNICSKNTLPSAKDLSICQESYSVEHILEKIMVQGKYQIKTIAIFCIQFMLISICIMTPGILFKEPIYICEQTVCTANQYNNFEGIKYISQESTNSLNVEYSLQGDKYFYATIGSSLIYLGGILGYFYLNPLSDKKGRKYAFRLCWLIASVGIAMMCLSHFLIFILLGYFILGVGIFGTIGIVSVYISEVTAGEVQSIGISVVFLLYSFSEILLYPLTLITDDWRYFFIYFIAIPLFIINFLLMQTAESPKYLSSINDKAGTFISLKQIFNDNGQKMNFKENQIEMPPKNDNNYCYKDIFKFPSLKQVSFKLIAMKIGICFIFFGINFQLSQMGGEYTINAIYIGIGDVLGFLAGSYICGKIQRTKGYFFLNASAVSFCLFILFTELPQDCNSNCLTFYIQMGLLMVARFFISIIYALHIIWCNEIFPTTIKNYCNGLVCSLGLVGAQIVPFVQQICLAYNVNPLLVFSVVALASGIPSLYIQETLGSQAPPEVEEVLMVNKNNNNNYDDIEMKLMELPKQKSLDGQSSGLSQNLINNQY